MRAGGQEWCEITLHRALMRQQMGDAGVAAELVDAAEAAQRMDGDGPHPRIQALIYNRRGWLHVEQYGEFATARRLFRDAASAAAAAGEPELQDHNYYFGVRSATERLMEWTDAWLGAWPQRRGASHLPNRGNDIEDAIAVLQRTRVEPSWRGLEQELPWVHAHSEFLIRTLDRDAGALRYLRQRASAFKGRAQHVYGLDLARWYLSEGEWAAARQQAFAAFYTYCQQCYPPGMALAAAVEAYARSGDGFRDRTNAYECLDRWVLALLLHPYETHPLRRAVRQGLRATVGHLSESHREWVRTYREDLERRIAEGNGVFGDVRVGMAPSASTRWMLS